MKRECETCVRNKLIYCPSSVDCLATDDKPYYQNRIMLLEENWKLKKQLEEKENQQKEFIEWLENRIEPYKKLSDTRSLSFENGIEKYEILQEVLSKHKEIIGDKDETH